MTARRALGALILCVLVAPSGCARHDHDDPGSADSTAATAAVRVASVETRTFEAAIVATGQWRSVGELVIAAPFAGMIEDLKPRVGDHVDQDETLGALVTRESWAALKGAELLRREARDDAGRAEAERALELARRDLVRVPLEASQPGVVVRRSAEPGSQVAETAEILAIVPLRNIVFEAHVPTSAGTRLRAGQRAEVIAAPESARAATVLRVLPMADRSDQSTLVWLTPSGSAPNMLDRYGTARIIVGGVHRASAVPDSAIVEDDLTGSHQVAVVDHDGRIAWKAVELGAAADGWHELTSPALPAGTAVVVAGQRGLAGGTRVQVAH